VDDFAGGIVRPGAVDCPVAVTAYLMCTDNMPSGSATKLGDVLSIRGGTTVEVVNTDAEGRLVMADALVLATEEPAPLFVPLFLRLGIAPQTVLAAYRIGDSPVNVVTPLMVYLPFIVLLAQKYKKGAGVGTVVSLMIPYMLILRRLVPGGHPARARRAGRAPMAGRAGLPQIMTTARLRRPRCDDE